MPEPESASRRRALVAGMIAATIVISITLAAIWWPFPSTMPRGYPALTVENGVLSSPISWSLPINSTGQFLGDFNVTSTVTENRSGNVSGLHVFVELFAQPLNFSDSVAFTYIVLFTGNISPGLDPGSVSIIFNNAVNGSAAAVSAQLTGVTPSMGVPSNLSGYSESLGAPGFSGWGSNGVVLPLVNQTGPGGPRYHFAFPVAIQANYPQPDPGSTRLNALQLRAELAGLGQSIYCQFSALVFTTNR